MKITAIYIGIVLVGIKVRIAVVDIIGVRIKVRISVVNIVGTFLLGLIFFGVGIAPVGINSQLEFCEQLFFLNFKKKSYSFDLCTKKLFKNVGEFDTFFLL